MNAPDASWRRKRGGDGDSIVPDWRPAGTFSRLTASAGGAGDVSSSRLQGSTERRRKHPGRHNEPGAEHLASGGPRRAAKKRRFIFHLHEPSRNHKAPVRPGGGRVRVQVRVRPITGRGHWRARVGVAWLRPATPLICVRFGFDWWGSDGFSFSVWLNSQRLAPTHSNPRSDHRWHLPTHLYCPVLKEWQGDPWGMPLSEGHVSCFSGWGTLTWSPRITL